MKVDSGAHYKLQKVSIKLTSGGSRSLGEAGGGRGKKTRGCFENTSEFSPPSSEMQEQLRVV